MPRRASRAYAMRADAMLIYVAAAVPERRFADAAVCRRELLPAPLARCRFDAAAERRYVASAPVFRCCRYFRCHVDINEYFSARRYF